MFWIEWRLFQLQCVKVSFLNSFSLFRNFNVKIGVCISLICQNSDIIATRTFSYLRSLWKHISLLSPCIYTFRRMGLSVVSVVFPLEIGKCTEWKKLKINVPNFNTVSLNTNFFIWILYSTHTLILNASKLEFNYFGVLNVPMKLL